MTDTDVRRRRAKALTPRRLKTQENVRTRGLWQEIFREDGEAFLDYYFSEKCRDNEAWVLEEDGEIQSMLHLNPYRFRIGSGKAAREEEIFYIVGVATREERRHSGYMSALLREAFRRLEAQGSPFVFLMPADERIYLPFDFRYIYRRENFELKPLAEGEKKEPGVCAEALLAVEKDAESMADFAERVLRRHAEVRTVRTGEYYRRLLKELDSQNGGILLLFKEGELSGLLSFDAEGEEVGLKYHVQEVLLEDGLYAGMRRQGRIVIRAGNGAGERESRLFDGEAARLSLRPTGTEKPAIMARIVRLDRMAELVGASGDITLRVRVRDPILRGNSGLFEWRIGRTGGRLDRIEEAGEGRIMAASLRGGEEGPELEAEISALTRLLFGWVDTGDWSVEAWLKENRLSVSPGTRRKLEKIEVLQRCLINEIV